MLIRNATFPDDTVRDIRIVEDRIEAVEERLQGDPTEGTIDAMGLRVLPGAIDVHVHFREPGGSHKETWETGTQSAAAGGVTTVVDQPNTDPPTITGETFDEKAGYASDALVDYGLNGGVTEEWDPDTLFDRPLFALGEVFLADSTGEMGIDPGLFESAVEKAHEAGLVTTVHAEDATQFDGSVTDRPDPEAWSAFRTAEAEISAVETTVEVAEDTGAPIHIAHTSTPEAAEIAHDAGLTCEVTPHHLFLSRDDLEELGTHGRMNPPLRSDARRAAMWDHLVEGTIDIVATDHAPHTAEEKDASIWEAPSGVPGVETMVPLLLAAAERGEITYDRIAEVTARRPAELFKLETKGRIAPGYDADLSLFDPADVGPIDPDDLHTTCTWTPFEGMEAIPPLFTLVRGKVVFEGGRFGDPMGQNVRTT